MEPLNAQKPTTTTTTVPQASKGPLRPLAPPDPQGGKQTGDKQITSTQGPGNGSPIADQDGDQDTSDNQGSSVDPQTVCNRGGNGAKGGQQNRGPQENGGDDKGSTKDPIGGEGGACGKGASDNGEGGDRLISPHQITNVHGGSGGQGEGDGDDEDGGKKPSPTPGPGGLLRSVLNHLHPTSVSTSDPGKQFPKPTEAPSYGNSSDVRVNPLPTEPPESVKFISVSSETTEISSNTTEVPKSVTATPDNGDGHEVSPFRNSHSSVPHNPPDPTEVLQPVTEAPPTEGNGDSRISRTPQQSELPLPVHNDPLLTHTSLILLRTTIQRPAALLITHLHRHQLQN